MRQYIHALTPRAARRAHQVVLRVNELYCPKGYSVIYSGATLYIYIYSIVLVHIIYNYILDLYILYRCICIVYNIYIMYGGIYRTERSVKSAGVNE